LSHLNNGGLMTPKEEIDVADTIELIKDQQCLQKKSEQGKQKISRKITSIESNTPLATSPKNE